MKKFFFFKILILGLIFGCVSMEDAAKDYPMTVETLKGAPNTAELYNALESDIEKQFDEIKRMVDAGKYGQALRKSKTMRASVRRLLFAKPNAKDQGIVIKYKGSLSQSSPEEIILNYLGGHFADLLNLHKRVEIFHAYTFVKRLSNGATLEERDKEVLQKTLVRVYDAKILLVNAETQEEHIVFESDVVDEHHTYLFQREIDMYLRDVGISSEERDTLFELVEKKRDNEKQQFFQKLSERRKEQCHQK